MSSIPRAVVRSGAVVPSAPPVATPVAVVLRAPRVASVVSTGAIATAARDLRGEGMASRGEPELDGLDACVRRDASELGEPLVERDCWRWPCGRRRRRRSDIRRR